MKITPTSFRKPASGGKAKQLVILLHGWGADGPNLIDIADVLSSKLPDAYFIAPNAPFVCEVNPFGFQWFSLMDRQPQHMLAGVRTAAELLNEFIDEQLSSLSHRERAGGEGIDEKVTCPNSAGEGIKVALIGFSQGTMVALHVALRRTPQVAAVVGFSGMLIAGELLAQEITARPPICLIHGEEDDVVPYPLLAQATENLRAVGVSVDAHTRPFLGHSIDMEGIETAGEFLKGRLG